MTPEVARISARWRELGTLFRADEVLSREALGALLAAYSGAGRHYHDLKHIDALLELSRAHRASLIDPMALDLAIFFHDAVYEASRPDNETASATMAGEWLRQLGVDSVMIEKVRGYIEATKHVGGGPEAVSSAAADPDLDYLLDFDLSVLAAGADVYDAYAAAIRREYSVYPDFLYRRGRAVVLAKLLAMPSLYRTPAFAAAWEARARANLARELAGL